MRALSVSALVLAGAFAAAASKGTLEIAAAIRDRLAAAR